MYKNSINNQCFKPSTLLQYKTELNGQVFVKCINEVYAEKMANPDMIIYVPVIYRLEKEKNNTYKGIVTWKEATICETKSLQCVTIDVDDNERKECCTKLTENKIYVTPNHIFIIECAGELKEKEAYLIQDNDKILYDAYKIYSENESPLFISDCGEIAAEDLYSESSEHIVETVKVKKCFTSVNSNKYNPWLFYGIVLTDSTDKCVIMPSGLISHDSSITY